MSKHDPKRKPPIVRVLVFDLSTDKQIRQKDMDLREDSKQEWLRRLIFWATCNNCSVEIINLNDHNKDKENEEIFSG